MYGLGDRLVLRPGSGSTSTIALPPSPATTLNGQRAASATTAASSARRPISRFASKTVPVGLRAACARAGAPTSRSTPSPPPPPDAAAANAT